MVWESELLMIKKIILFSFLIIIISCTHGNQQEIEKEKFFKNSDKLFVYDCDVLELERKARKKIYDQYPEYRENLNEPLALSVTRDEYNKRYAITLMPYTPDVVVGGTIEVEFNLFTCEFVSNLRVQ